MLDELMTSTSRLSDATIRKALLRQLQKHHSTADTIVLHEFDFIGARADMAVVNGKLHGYEIKSDLDTLARLETQVPAYGSIFDRATIVVATRHLQKVVEIVPDWWGISEATLIRNKVQFKAVRGAKNNPDRTPMAIARLMWRKEALMALRTRGLHIGLTKSGVMKIWRQIAENVPLAEIAFEARAAIKARYASRSVLQRIPDDDSCTTEATLSPHQHSRHRPL
jgi:hypothetical protein